MLGVFFNDDKEVLTFYSDYAMEKGFVITLRIGEDVS